MSVGFQGFTHLDERGKAFMVNVTGKEPTRRRAVARAVLDAEVGSVQEVSPERLAHMETTAVAVAALASAWTPKLIPLCHQVRLDSVSLKVVTAGPRIALLCSAEATDRTGVEMEALTAVTFGALALVAQSRELDPRLHLSEVRLVLKEGGRSGRWVADPPEVTVRLFAQVRELAGKSTFTLGAFDVQDALSQLAEVLGDQFKALDANCSHWVGQNPATEATPLLEGDEVSVLPPVSGGTG
jgi:cyclic pyranopterin phosphate synthase